MRLATRVVRRLGWRGPFEPTRHVWSRGLALLCDHNGGVGFVREQRGGQAPVPIDPHFYDGVQDGELVWTRATSLPQFIAQVLPRSGLGLCPRGIDYLARSLIRDGPTQPACGRPAPSRTVII